jgi:hypothetical protein
MDLSPIHVKEQMEYTLRLKKYTTIMVGQK